MASAAQLSCPWSITLASELTQYTITTVADIGLVLNKDKILEIPHEMYASQIIHLFFPKLALVLIFTLKQGPRLELKSYRLA
jgi:hypothetical protein